MNSDLLPLLCDPVSGENLTLKNPIYDTRQQIQSGELLSPSGKCYPIVNGIPRFIEDFKLEKNAADAFGEQWNEFNYIDFERHWKEHTVKNTFGSTDVFKNKWIVDAGGGSGSQTLWMLKAGAKRVILLEISDSVDQVVPENLSDMDPSRYDVIQCSIDQPPLRSNSIPDIVICHNVIQHTPSVEKTAKALYGLVQPNGEFVFNCYAAMYKGAFFKLIKPYKIYNALRTFLPKRSFGFRLWYCRITALLSLIPFLGLWMKRLHLCICGELPKTSGFWASLKRKYRVTFLVTFDWYGAHRYQHLLSHQEMQKIVSALQPYKVLNEKSYYENGETMPGIALRLFKKGNIS